MVVLFVVAQLAVGGLLVVAGGAKALGMSAFRHAVHSYRLVPSRAVPVIAVGVAAAELTAGAALLLDVVVRWAAVAAALLLASFAGGMAINLRRGRRIACSCAGSARDSRISWPLVARNIVLVATALMLAVAGASGATWHQTRAPLIIAAVALLAAAQVAILGRRAATQLRMLLAGGVP